MNNRIIVLESSDKKSVVKVLNGELISYKKYGKEYIHQKGDQGWGNSDTEMFPLIGPTKLNNYRVSTNRGECIQDQHGLSREIPYEIIDLDDQSILYQKTYLKDTLVRNSKFPEKSSEKMVFWYYNFAIKKHFILNDESLEIRFTINTENDMPYMFGYHPAFRLNGNKKEYFSFDENQVVTLQDVMDRGSIAYPLQDTENISLVNEEGTGIKIATVGFGNIMLWTEVPNMVCIEPITHYPQFDTQQYSEENMRISKGKEVFSVKLIPFLKE